MRASVCGSVSVCMCVHVCKCVHECACCQPPRCGSGIGSTSVPDCVVETRQANNGSTSCIQSIHYSVRMNQ